MPFDPSNLSPELVTWLVFGVVIAVMLALDLFVFHRDAHEVSMREAGIWSAVWVGLGLGFGAFVFALRGPAAGGEYLAGYAIEKTLSIDNVFVFTVLFAAFAVPARYQHRLLFWGVIGAIVFRAIFIALGATLLEAFHITIYLLGALLLFTAWRMWRSRTSHAMDPSSNPVLRLFKRFVPTTPDYRGAAFLVRDGGRLMATPLLAVLLVVETTDVLFAIDSIPAVFAVTSDPFIVFTSNAFAILGLRALYFLLAGLVARFVYLKAGLAALLAFAGAKMLLSDVVTIPIPLTLAIIVGILGVAILASIRAGAAEKVASPA